MAHTFKTLTLTEPVRIWLTEMYRNEDFDPKKARVKLRKDLPKGFSPRSIDSRLCKQDHLTLIGIWHIDPESEVFRNVSRVIEDIREAIMREPEIKSISAIQIAARTKIKDRDVERALFLMNEMGTFRTVGTGAGGARYSSISFADLGEDVYDAYLYFDNLDNVMEQFYTRRQSNPGRTGLAGPVSARPGTALIAAPAGADPASATVRRIVEEVCEALGIEVSDVSGNDGVNPFAERLRIACESEFVICDLSGADRGLYYLIGYLHALGREPVLLVKRGTIVDSEMFSEAVSEFRDAEDLKEKLTARLRSLAGQDRKRPDTGPARSR
ncbi:MAG: hypothetical protein ACYCQK_00570 [Acidiferrobacteraceae bacterium]